jgi:hypothetical protein
MKIQNRIYKTELIEWQKVKDLQPDNLKLPYNYEHIKNSILKYGVSKAYDVCVIDGELYWIDGHTRTQIMLELLNDGIKIPDKLTANFCEVKDKKEAIEILLEVHNQRQNPIAEDVLSEWIEVEQLEVNVDSLNVVIEEVDLEDEEHEKTVQELTNMIAFSLTDEEQKIWLHTKEKIGIKKDKNVIFELIKKYSNENDIN